MTSQSQSEVTRQSNGHVVLVYPATGIEMASVSVFLPLSVLLPASALEEAGYTVSVVDQRIDPNWRDALRTELKKNPLYVGVSAMTGPQIRAALSAAEEVRAYDAAIPVIWGGIHPTILPEQTLVDDRVDAVVIGKGEEVAVEIAGAIRKGGPEAVRGATFESPNRYAKSGCDMPQPTIDYDLVDWQRYVTPAANGYEGLAHVTSRGCPHRCRYCYNRSINRSKWRGMPAERVVEDLERLSALGCNAALLFDDNFFASRRRIREVVDLILERGLNIKIKADCRADYLLRYTDEELSRLNRAGFEVLFVGAESGSDRILELVSKDVTVRQLLEANRRLARADIKPHYSFMAGLPDETPADVKATVRLMQRLKRDHPGALLSPIKGYVPYPGTSMYDRTIELGFTPPDTLEGWSDFNWNGTERPWLSRRMRLLVEKATYVTSGIDTDLAAKSGLKRNPVLWQLFLMYARVLRKRCDMTDFGAMPELPILRFMKKWMSVA